MEYHRLGYQAKLDYWQEVAIVMMIIMLMIDLTIVMRMIIIMMMTLTIVIVIIIKTCLQVGGKPSRWPQILVTLAYAEKVALMLLIMLYIVLMLMVMVMLVLVLMLIRRRSLKQINLLAPSAALYVATTLTTSVQLMQHTTTATYAVKDSNGNDGKPCLFSTRMGCRLFTLLYIQVLEYYDFQTGR